MMDRMTIPMVSIMAGIISLFPKIPNRPYTSCSGFDIGSQIEDVIPLNYRLHNVNALRLIEKNFNTFACMFYSKTSLINNRIYDICFSQIHIK